MAAGTTGDPATPFTAEQAVRTQRQLRRLLGLDTEQFSLPEFVGMISDEIAQMRAAGQPDWKITDAILEQTGQVVSPEELDRFYISPESRHSRPG